MSQRKNTPAPLKRGIINDHVHPYDILNLNFTHSCETCSYFNPPNQSCVFGHKSEPHLYKNQLKTYDISGRMPLCRNHEID